MTFKYDYHCKYCGLVEDFKTKDERREAKKEHKCNLIAYKTIRSPGGQMQHGKAVSKAEKFVQYHTARMPIFIRSDIKEVAEERLFTTLQGKD